MTGRGTIDRTRTRRPVVALAVGVVTALVTALLPPAVVAAWPSGNTAPVKTLAGGNTGLNRPSGIAFGPDGRMYVPNANSVTAYAVDWATGNTAPVKTLTGTSTGLSQPVWVAFDSSGRMYVNNFNLMGSSVTVYAADWADGDTAPVKTLSGGNTGLFLPRGLAFDSSGRMYVANQASGKVTVYAADWADGDTAPVKTLNNASSGVENPFAVAFDDSDRMYVANSGATSSVTVYAADWPGGNTAPVKTLAGAGTGLSGPRGVAFDATGRMYVVNGSGSVTMYADDWAGGNTAPLTTLSGAATGLNDPFGVAFDGSGRMHVSNYSGNTITVYGTDPGFTADPDPVAFGNVPVGSTASMTVTVTDTGTGDLVFGANAVTVTGSGAADYTVAADTCSGTTVATAGTCTVDVSFSPTVNGARPAALQFTDNAAGSPQSVTITGTGTVPGLTAAPDPVAFGDVLVGATGSRTVTVTNSGTGPLVFGAGAVAVSGTGAADYTVEADTCSGTTVAASGTCTVDVAFTPTATGSRSADLQFTDNAPDSPQTVALTGTGTTPVFTAEPDPAAFGDVTVGSAGTLAVTVANAGTAPLVFGADAVTVIGDVDFAVESDACSGTAVAAAGTCQVRIMFEPASTGPRTATLRFSDNAGDSPQTVTLTGTGITPPVTPTPTTSPSTPTPSTPTSSPTPSLTPTTTPSTTTPSTTTESPTPSLTPTTTPSPTAESPTPTPTPTPTASPPPSTVVTVTAVSPASGKQAGGSRITVQGSGFASGAVVTFGSNPATDVTVESATRLTATTPPGAAGTVPVTVTNPDGTTATLPDAFTYTLPRARQFPTVPLRLPEALKRVGPTLLLDVPILTNAGQRAEILLRVALRTSRTGHVPAGDLTWGRFVRSRGRIHVVLTGAVATRITVTVSAPATDGYAAYRHRTVYRTRAAS